MVVAFVYLGFLNDFDEKYCEKFSYSKYFHYFCMELYTNSFNSFIMPKYNISEKKQKNAYYRTQVNPTLMDDLKAKILDIVLIRQKYKDKRYSARQLALDLGTNTRYVSAVINVKFHMNYTSFINRFRIDEAMTLLVDKRYLSCTMEEISDMVGFSNRQSFYASFYKITNMTPLQYQTTH